MDTIPACSGTALVHFNDVCIREHPGRLLLGVQGSRSLALPPEVSISSWLMVGPSLDAPEAAFPSHVLPLPHAIPLPPLLSTFVKAIGPCYADASVFRICA